MRSRKEFVALFTNSQAMLGTQSQPGSCLVCSILRRERFSLAWLKQCMTDRTSMVLRLDRWRWVAAQVIDRAKLLERLRRGIKVPRRTPGEGVGWCPRRRGGRKGPGLTYNDTTGADQSDLFLQGYSAPSRACLVLRAGVRSAPTRVSVSGSLFHLSP